MVLAEHPVSPLRQDPYVRKALENLPPSSDPSWLLHAAAAGEQVTASLASLDVLGDMARRVGECAKRLGCDAVAGASTAGDQLAGATASLQALAVYHPGRGAHHVLLVDSVLVTGTALDAMAKQLRADGVAEIDAAVLIDLGATGGQAYGMQVSEVG